MRLPLMPTTMRLLLILVLLGGLVYGIMLALARFIEPTPHLIVERLPATLFVGPKQ